MKFLLSKILFPLPRLVRWYLSKKRTTRYQSLRIEVLPGVFHPGLFFSTRMILSFLDRQSMNAHHVLDIGAGTGVIALAAAHQGAVATALDISPKAIENIRLNSEGNRLAVRIIQSDLFDNLPVQKFDWIFINPPYYPHDPANEEDFAWKCGKNHEYFIRLFSRLKDYTSSSTQAIMVLSEVCDLKTIFAIASERKFELIKLEEKEVWADGKNYIFQIKPLG